MPVKKIRAARTHAGYIRRLERTAAAAMAGTEGPSARMSLTRNAAKSMKVGAVMRRSSEIAWNGNPDVQPPELVRPLAARAPLGHCDDDQDHLPPHKRQRRPAS